MKDELLNVVSKRISEFDQKNNEANAEYNIFKVLEVSEKEVILCRMLADLLNPFGYHKCGSIFLKMFIEDVLQIYDFTEQELVVAEVYKEYLIPKTDKRIDIVICIGKRFIPIEVKINAFDQEAQCYDYYYYALDKMNSSDAKVYYLTKYGTMPSIGSMISKGDMMPRNGVKPIAFSTDICRWIKKCIFIANGAIKELLQQYLQTIEEFTGVANERKIKIVRETLLEKKEFFSAGIIIEKSIISAKEKLLTSVFEEFEEQIEDEKSSLPCKLIPLGDYSWYYYKQQVPLYYKQKGVSWPGVTYLIEGVDFEDGKQLWLRIEVEENIYAGLCLFDPMADDGNGAQVDEMSDETKEMIKKHLNVNYIDNEYWWVKWFYLPTGTHEIGTGKSAVPNFKYMNEMATELVDACTRKAFVEHAIKMIKEQLLSVLKIESH